MIEMKNKSTKDILVRQPANPLQPRRLQIGRFLSILYRRVVQPMIGPIVAIFLALLVGAAVILIAKENPIKAYSALLNGAFGGTGSLLRTLRWTAPLMVSGLAAVVAFRAGMFNIGIEGSLWVGGLAATLIGVYISGLPSVIHISLSLIVGALVGGLWALGPGVARVKYKVDEVVFTLMLNYVAILLVQYLIRYYFLDTTRLALSFAEPETRYILPSAELPYLNEDYKLSISIIIAIALVILFYFIFKRSVWGYETHMTGLNMIFARFSGIPVVPVAIMAMVVSGALGGVTGALDVLGNYHKFFARFSAGIGFDGITIALMGKLNPIGVLISSVFLGALKNGGAAMERDVNVSRNIVVVIQGLVLLFVTAERLYEWLRLKRRERAEE